MRSGSTDGSSRRGFALHVHVNTLRVNYNLVRQFDRMNASPMVRHSVQPQEPMVRPLSATARMDRCNGPRGGPCIHLRRCLFGD